MFSDQIGLDLEKTHFKLFPKKNPNINSTIPLIYRIICKNTQKSQNQLFSRFLENTVLDPSRHKNLKIFKKFKISPFAQYIHCWANSLQKKSYSNLKVRHTPVSHLCLEFSYEVLFTKKHFIGNVGCEN